MDGIYNCEGHPVIIYAQFVLHQFYILNYGIHLRYSIALLHLAVVIQLKWSLPHVSQGSNGLVTGLLNLNAKCQMLSYLTYYKLLRLVEIAPRDILIFSFFPSNSRRQWYNP